MRRDSRSALVILAAATAIMLASHESQAQGGLARGTSQGARSGSCDADARFMCLSLEATKDEAGAEYDSPRFVVLWRMPQGVARVSPRDTLAMAISERQQVAFRRAAEDRRHQPMVTGTGRYWAGVSHSSFLSRRPFMGPATPAPRDSLFVLDSAFELPTGDSVLVVLVEGMIAPDAPPPRLTHASVHAAPWVATGTKHWRNGETSFVVRPRRGDDRLRRFLFTIPPVVAFLADSTAPPR
jgi:hypothetical protein